MRGKNSSKKNKTKTVEEILQKLTVRDRAIYGLLTNPDCIHTQSAVARRLHIAKSTVSNVTSKLLAVKVIYKHKNDKKLIIYRKGINYQIVESHLEIDKINGDYQRLLNHQVVEPSSEKIPHQSIWRMHLGHGGWIDITVEKEGTIHSFDERINENKTIPIILFGEAKPNEKMKGLIKWDARIMTDRGSMLIRYQKSKNPKGISTFGICPASLLICGSDDRIQKGQAMDFFYGMIVPIFNKMEKWGGWKFKKDSDGNYEFRSKAIPEFGADSYVAKIMTDLRGKYFGIPGVTKDWYDTSGEAGSLGEYETNDTELVVALSNLPERDNRAEQLNILLKEFGIRIDDLTGRVVSIEKKIEGGES